MNGRIVAVATAGAVAIAALAYTVGVRYGGADKTAAIETDQSTPALLTPMTSDGAMALAQFSDDERTGIEAIIRDYLMTNPEIIRDAINELQRKQDEAEQVAQTKAISENTDLIFNSDKQIVLGNPNGDVTLVEFFDYNCAYCRRAQADMAELIDNDPQLRVVLKEFPVLGDGSVQAAQVSAAVFLTAPESAGEFHSELLATPGQVDGERALAVAEDLGLDTEALRAKLDSDEVKSIISESYDLAGKLSLTGTPSYVTQREVVVGAVGYAALKAKIDDVRACATAAC